MADIQMGLLIIVILQGLVNCFLLVRCDKNAEAIILLTEIAKGRTDIIKAHQKKFDEAVGCL